MDKQKRLNKTTYNEWNDSSIFMKEIGEHFTDEELTYRIENRILLKLSQLKINKETSEKTYNVLNEMEDLLDKYWTISENRINEVSDD
jgi:hypothetical protein